MDRAFDLEELLAESGWLRQLAASLVGDGGRADDLVQDTWLAALRRPPRSAEEPRPWLARVVGNLARNKRRGRARRAERESLVHEERIEPGPDALAQAAEAQRMLAEAVTRLAEPLRAVVVLRYFQGLDSAAAAARLGVPASTLRTRLQRALEELRADLDRRCKGERSAWALLLAPLAREARGGTAAGLGAAPAVPLGVWLAAAGLLGLLALGARQWNAARAGGEREETLASASAAAEREPAEPALATTGDAREPVAAPVVAPSAPLPSGQPPADFQSEISGTVLVDGRAPEWPLELTLEPELPPAEPGGLRRRMPRPVLTLAPEQRGMFTFPRLPADWRGRLVVDGYELDGGGDFPIEKPASGLVVKLSSAPQIVGRILGPDGLPIPDLMARYEFRIGLRDKPANEVTATSLFCRDDGRFRIPGKSRGSCAEGQWASLTFVVEADGHGYLRHDTPNFVPSEGHDVGDLTLERVDTLEFVVRDANGNPIAGSFARIDGFHDCRRSEPTDADGRGLLGWMPERSAAVRFSALGYEDRVLTVEPGSSPEVVLEPLTMLTVHLRGSAERLLLSSESPAFVWDTNDRPYEKLLQMELGGPQSSTHRSAPGQRWEYEYFGDPTIRLIGLAPGVALTLEAKDSSGRTLAADTLSLARGARAELELGEPGADGEAPASATGIQSRTKEPR